MALGDFIHTVLDTMKEHVELRVVLSKILSDHANAEFREFRETILGILDTYGYEQNILFTANHLIEKDMYNHVKQLHRGLSRAFAPKSHRCMTCSAPLPAVPMSNNAQQRARGGGAHNLMCVAFGCGHSFHETCLGAGDESCPLCEQERRKTRRRWVWGCHVVPWCGAATP